MKCLRGAEWSYSVPHSFASLLQVFAQEIMSPSLVPHMESHFEIRIVFITVLSCKLFWGWALGENVWCHTCFEFRESLIFEKQKLQAKFLSMSVIICKCFVWFVKSICCHTVWRQCNFTSPPQVRHHKSKSSKWLKHVEQSSCYFWPCVQTG